MVFELWESLEETTVVLVSVLMDGSGQAIHKGVAALVSWLLGVCHWKVTFVSYSCEWLM
jgi:hypothetical protein